MKALPYIILGIFLTIGLGLIIAGCFINNDYFILLELIPAIFLSIFCVILKHRIERDDSKEEGIITMDFIIFCIAGFGSSLIALPVVLYRIGKISSMLSLILTIAGLVTIGLGGGIIQCLKHKEEVGFY
ncbi:vacuolar protein sorting 55 family [Trichomonas vaginalis G3]|uniref:vacuolar protein sorting 55 family n=1 Tax=Trichomonas vaginalis (strain ATCC PRA-98 / G3) TaxID=412133 RepID=UPI0021E59652|nr:vacuolar protein sorting 55 family [Trichomonas vaginalis G3]KAI5510872.1 vacuolar protein sorting 55 family [Trichomonas vaginalis G3]